ncbi:NAD(P)/FAD-dependent oxidoreductase [Phreatobacter stygius]|uniref:FAD-binding oxidoreductase n=1 Tax=Phreatobacter stygius TaxID=1940610 RepID=A0A4D7B2T3_9HYPH|nr:FAD-dependent oxidoreductase [Phreatobacter stygius]QCI64390.1 FAD-binding oxidoreductase [Phreatobacter stygius]
MSQLPVDVAVVGGGMVGMATALACLERGLTVVVVDPGVIREAASYGNAGVISRGSLFPVAGPGVLGKLPRYALNRDPAIRIDYRSLAAVAPWLLGFVRRCNEASWRAAAAALDPLCAASYDEHWRIAGEIGARSLIERRGWLKLYRSDQAFAGSALEREILAQHKVEAEVIDGPELIQFEPALKRRFAKGLWHKTTGSVRDPGGLVLTYAEAVRARGGQFRQAKAAVITEDGEGALVRLEGGGDVRARTVVLAAGAAAESLTRTMGYRLPLAAERGYHRHFADAGEHKLSRPIYDTGGAYVVAPMNIGLRLLSGVELARRDAPLNPAQLREVEPEARATLSIGEPVEPMPWGGARPSTPDGLPVIGRAPRHGHVVFAFGHGHIGLSTGPVTGKLVAELITGQVPSVPLAPFAAERF